MGARWTGEKRASLPSSGPDARGTSPRAPLAPLGAPIRRADELDQHPHRLGLGAPSAVIGMDDVAATGPSLSYVVADQRPVSRSSWGRDARHPGIAARASWRAARAVARGQRAN